MLHKNERQQVIDYCLRMTDDGLTLGTSGNISQRVDDHVVITPSSIPYDELTPDSICVLDMAGNVIEGDLKPSTEVPFHELIYSRTDARAVIHTHPVFGTVVGTLCDELPLIHYMLALHGGPVRVANYARFGTQELADSIATAMVDRKAVLLRNHGAACWDDTLASAYNLCQYLEWVCKVWVIARAAGNPSLLSPEQFDEAMVEITGSRYRRNPNTL
ncbi:class II aldolase/adducin family protein [Cutibacterium avidum]|uniref:class II aldolase/adducin family protein n=1 Tax=Cutibacterium avidum TaxID=33010 RepID=UPI00083E7B2F|nr:class II aldolase/adducin family protein [Cutibacterium avidum]AOG28004.1 hypothetical protein BFS79_05115 [Cutibacterium avidum]